MRLKYCFNLFSLKKREQNKMIGSTLILLKECHA